MYLAQEIAASFGLKSVGSISTTINKLKYLLIEDRVLLNTIEEIIDEYDS